MIESAAAAVGDGIIGVTVGEGVALPAVSVDVESVPIPESAPEPAAEEPKRARRGPLSLAQRLEEMRGMYERRIARKRLIETRLAAELAELRASIGEDEAELSTLSARPAGAASE